MNGSTQVKSVCCPLCVPLEESIVQYATVCRAQSGHLKSFSCSDTPQDDSGLTTPQNETLTKLCDDVAARIEARIKQQRQNLNEQRYLGNCQLPYKGALTQSPFASYQAWP